MDIKENTPTAQAVQRENNFFANHPVYSTIPGEIFGTQDKLHYIWQLVHEFSVRFKNSISGTYEKTKLSKTSHKPAGAKIKLIFQDLYSEYNDLDYQPLKKYKDEDVMQIIQKYQAQTIPGFLPVDAFYALLNPELKKLFNPAFDTVDQAYSILEEYATTILNAQLSQLPSVQAMLQAQILEVIQECKRDAHDAVSDILEAEINYIFTNDWNYLAGKPFVKFGQQAKETKQTQGNFMVAELKNKIEHYFRLVVRATRDNIPKLIGYFLVKGCQTKMLMTLQQNLMQNQSMLSVISEDVNVVEERKKLNKEVETFRNAQKIIKRDPDLSEYILSAQQDREEEASNEKQEAKEIQKESQPKLQEKPQVQIKKEVPPKTDIPTVVENPPQKPNTPVVQKQQPQQQQQQPSQQNQQQQPQQVKPPNALFGGVQSKTPNPTTTTNTQANSNPLGGAPKSSQTLTQQYNQQVDKQVAAFYEDERVQEKMKTAGGEAGKAALKSQVPGAPDWALNMAEKAGQQAATSDAAKQAAINATTQQLKVDDQPPQSQQKKGLFSFMKQQ